MTTTVLHNQSLFDVLLQHTGSIAGIFDVAYSNGVSITGELSPGRILKVDGVQTDQDVLDYYTAKRVQPATAIIFDTVSNLEGISIWAINTNFEIQ